MSLLTSWGSQNYQEHSGLIIQYSTRESQNFYNEIDLSGYVVQIPYGYDYTRYATKCYSFVGMTRSAAYNCAQSKLMQYTRAYSFIGSTYSSVSRKRVYQHKTVTECKTTIQITHVDGGMYNVDIIVSEEDSRWSANNVSPSTIFSSENSRNYDAYGGGGGGDTKTLTITGVSDSTGIIGIRFSSTGFPYGYNWGSLQATLHREDGSSVTQGTTYSDGIAFTPFSIEKSLIKGVSIRADTATSQVYPTGW